MPKKQVMMVGGVLVVILFVAAGIGIYRFSQGAAPTAPSEPPKAAERKRRTSQFNTIPVNERPYLQIVPGDGGRNILLRIVELKKPAETSEYELEYQAGELLQGAFGEINLTSLPATADILLGSCSAGGACTFHKNVQGGSLITRFGGSNEYALKNDWRYIENTKKERTAASKDAKFQLTSPELTKQRYLVITNSPGYPGTLPGTPISEIYTLATNSPLTGKVELSIRANEEAATAKLAVWTGSSWKVITGQLDQKTLTATTEFGQAYVVIKE